MTRLSGNPTSLWLDTTPDTAYPPLAGEVSVDVAVLGGGITGLTAAVLLKRGGATVAVVEMDRVAAGVSGYTTAKVTSLHTLTYSTLVSKFGEAGARVYGEANEAAIARVAAFVEEDGIDCEFERQEAFTYTESGSQVRKIEEEVEAASKLGLPASLVTATDLPFDIAAAVRFTNQAHFHPRKYLLGLAELIPGGGSHVFEKTRAVGVRDGDPCEVRTDRGTLSARDVIVATHMPFLDRGLYFARTHPERSYAIGVRIRGRAPEGMYITSEPPTRSIRHHPLDGDEIVIVSGEGHKTGQGGDTAERYAILEEYARERFDVRSVDYRWSTQDMMPMDGAPYIGKLSPISKRIYTGTGYKKWGMTNGTVAAMILSDLILGRANPWAEVFDSSRVKPLSSAKDFVKENVNVAKQFIGDRLSRPTPLDQLAPGEGRLADLDGERVAAYRDEAGIVHAVSPVCTHMGCLVHWNEAERTWDCPCHGSRYGIDGEVIQGPAVKELERKQAP